MTIYQERDVKGLFGNAGLNLIKNFTGVMLSSNRLSTL
ncbi:hypothetical protein [Pedobacter sp. P26]